MKKRVARPPRGRGRPRKASKEVLATLEQRIKSASTIEQLDAISAECHADTIAGRLPISASEASRAWCSLRANLIKAAATERAMRELGERALVLTDDDVEALETRWKKRAAKPLGPGEGVAAPKERAK